MSVQTLEQRVSLLEQEVAEIKAQQSNGSKEKPWLRTIGKFAGDEVMKEIFDEALKYRERDRERARRRSAKKVPKSRVKK
jgi:hypothetical protein